MAPAEPSPARLGSAGASPKVDRNALVLVF
jgi:hypothetical protein